MRWMPLKHAVILLEYSDGSVDITDYVADAGHECQNFVMEDGTVAERVHVRYAPAETPLAANQAIPPPGVANFGLPAVHAFPTGHFPVDLFDFTGDEAPTWTRAQVKSVISSLTGNDEVTQAKVDAHRQKCTENGCGRDERDKGILEAYNAAGLAREYQNESGEENWLFVRYNNWHLNCQHYQEALAEILSKTDVSTPNLSFRLFGHYQRLLMEENGETSYVM